MNLHHGWLILTKYIPSCSASATVKNEEFRYARGIAFFIKVELRNVGEQP